MDGQTWTIGELAARSGLTVRALRHFEDKGLLRPVPRDASGHRSYTRADVERVYRIVALRSLGLPLAEIPVALESAPALAEALRVQLAQVEQQLGGLHELAVHLRRAVAGTQGPDDQPISTKELMSVIHKTAISNDLLHEYLEEADVELLARRGAELGDAGTSMVQQDYPRLYAAAQEQFAAGVAPQAPAMQRIAGELEQLGQSWREPGPAADDSSVKVQTMWAERSAEIVGRDYGDLARYVMAAREHYGNARTGSGSS